MFMFCAIWSTNSMLPISIFRFQESPWCCRPAIWAKPNAYLSPTLPTWSKAAKKTCFSHDSALIVAPAPFVCPSSLETDSLNHRIWIGVRLRSVLALALTDILFTLLREGWGGRFAVIGLHVWGGGGVVGRVAGMFGPCGVQSLGTSKCLHVVFILHAIQMSRNRKLHSTQKLDMQVHTWRRRNTESKDTFHRISTRD